jgi:hypothetical protein
MANQNQPTSAEEWEFSFVEDQLLMKSRHDPDTQIRLSAQAAFDLLSYLSERRDALYWASHQGQREEPEHDWREPSADVEESGL